MDLKELLERIGAVAEANADDLATLEQDILTAYAALRADEDRSDETIEALAQLADALDGVRARSDELATEREAQEARLAEIDARIQPAEVAETEPEEIAPEPDPAVEPDESTETVPETTETEPIVAEEPEPEREAEPIAASSGPTSLERLARRRPQVFAPRQSEGISDMRIIALAEVPGVSAGSEIHDLHQLDEVIARRLNGIMNGTGRLEAPVATFESPDRSRRVAASLSGEQNTAVVSEARDEYQSLVAAGDFDALTAAGGVCGPVTPYYQQNTIGQTSRPVAGSLPAVSGDRGGIRFVPPPKLTDILVDQAGGAVGLHTNQNDIDAVAKTVQSVDCGTEQEVKVDAIFSALQFGNTSSRFHPERVQAFRELTAVAYARRADQRLLTLIDASSTAVADNTLVVGATRDLLHIVAQAVAGYRSRQRMADDAPFQAIFPAWVLDLVQADLVLTGAVPLGDVLNIARSTLTTALRNLGVNPTYSPDRQIFGAQGVGGVLDFPDTVVWNLFPAGSFVHIDGGTLDLGIVRDSTLNLANKFQMFMESWESVAFVGVQALKVTSKVCADGLAAGVKDTSAICSGASYGS